MGTEAIGHPFAEQRMPLPNCIIETTVCSSQHPDGTPHAMVLYDGSSWRDVQLPSELLHATYSDFDPEQAMGLDVACVTSDRVFHPLDIL